MTKITPEVGWRGFSKAAETSFGSEATVNASFNYQGDPLETEPQKVWVNTDEVDGEFEPTAIEILQWHLGGEHQQRLMPANLALFARLALGGYAVTEPETGVYQHVCQPVSTLEMKSRSMLEYNGQESRKYLGVTCGRIEISGEREDYVNFNAMLMGAASEATGSTTRPTKVAESYLKFRDVQITRGGTFNPTGYTVTGGTDLSVDLVSFNYVYDAKPKPRYEANQTDGYVDGFDRSGRTEIEHTLQCVFEVTDTTHRSGLTGGTEYVIDIPIVGAQIGETGKYYTGRIIVPRAVYKEAKRSRDGNKLIVSADFQILHDTSDTASNSVFIIAINEEATYN